MNQRMWGFSVSTSFFQFMRVITAQEASIGTCKRQSIDISIHVMRKTAAIPKGISRHIRISVISMLRWLFMSLLPFSVDSKQSV